MKVKRARKILEKLAKNCYRTSCRDCVFLDNNGSCIFKREPSAIYEDFLSEHKDDFEDAYEDYWGGEGD